MIELRHLRSLIAIAESGKLAAAAERVYLTQSALSHQVKLLEKHYGISLFERTSTGLRFTPGGTRLLQLAHQAVALVADAERDLLRLKEDHSGELRIVLECHTCFDWLMPVLDEFRQAWPEVEVDLVAGFHSTPLTLLEKGKADLVIGSKLPTSRAVSSQALFRFEILGVLPVDHALRSRRTLEAGDFANQTLITYPVPEDRIDMIRDVLKPAKVPFKRRTAELTIAILQLVASKRGLAALPNWGLKNYIEQDYIIAKRIGRSGLWSDLYATGAKGLMKRPFAQDLLRIVREQCAANLDGIKLL